MDASDLGIAVGSFRGGRAMSSPIACGIDFGTSNSAISVAYPDGAHLVPLGANESDVMPSLVYLDSSRQRLAGFDAVRQYLVAGSFGSTRLLASIKSSLADPNWTGTETPWGEWITPEELVAIVIGDLKRHAERYCGEEISSAVLGHPVLFDGADGPNGWERQELAKSRLDRAARLAGFRQTAFADESIAAVAAEHDMQGVLVGLDFGGGTFDVSVVSMEAGHRELLATHGAAIGGERFDSLLFDDALAEPLGLNSEYHYNGKSLRIPRHLRRLGTLQGALTLVGDNRTRGILDNFRAAGGGHRLKAMNEIIFGGHGYLFFKELEGAKIELSSATKTRIRFNRPGIAVNEKVTAQQFSRLIAPDLDRIDGVVASALSDAGVRAKQVENVVRTGGSSQIPAFVRRVHDRFGADKVTERDALATVALGLGLIGLEYFA